MAADFPLILTSAFTASACTAVIKPKRRLWVDKPPPRSFYRHLKHECGLRNELKLSCANRFRGNALS